MVKPGPQSIAFAKTTRPAIGSTVHRERLFALLDGTPGRTVAWIAGAPGSGKTTLAASYVEARRYRCLWYQIDPDDADVATFFHYLSHAARKLDAARARELPAFTPQYGPDVASFSRKFFRQLFSRAKEPFALVLDNLHAVPLESPLHAVLDAAFGQVPKNCCVIVTSRGEPPASFARLRAAGEMACVGGDNLRVEPEELVEIARVRGQSLAAEAAAQLHERTRGWAAGLVLMLEHAKLSGRIAEVPGDATPKVIFDYLAGEIFDRFEADTKRCLLKIACLPRMTAAVAEALSGEAKVARLLLNLALNDYFVREVRSDEGRVFELHPLLRDFLRARAAQELPEAVGPAQLQRAAALVRAAGHTEDAVSLLVECADWNEVARIAAEEAGAMLDQGRSETLGRWLEMLPRPIMEQDPRLLFAYGACRAQASPRAARRFFEQAYEGYRRDGAAGGMRQSACGVVAATIFEFDDLAQLDHWIGVLAGLLGDAAGKPSAPVDRIASASLIRALLLRAAGDERLDASLQAMAPEFASDLALLRAATSLLRGEFAAAGAIIEGLQAKIAELPAPDKIATGFCAALLDMLLGAHERALSTARAALETADAEGMRAYDEWLRAIAAAAALGAGDRDGARGELQHLENAGARLRRGDRALIHYLRGWLASLEGDAVGANREAKAALGLAVEIGVPWLECLVRAALAQLLAAGNDRRGCDTQLRSAEAIVDRLRSPLLRFVVRLAAADSAREANDDGAALDAIRTAFPLGREHGFRHVPWWRSRAIAELCALALRHGVEPEFARGLVRERKLVPRIMPWRIRDWPWPFRVHALGRFQLLRDAAAVEFSGKGPGRPMELLKVLIALGGQNVRADQIADALWPHVEADYAHKSFTATLHRLRRLLEDEDALLLRDGRLSLNPALIWADSWALDHAFAEIDDALRAPGTEAMGPALRALADDVFALYRGPFLPDESEQPSYIACREQIRSRMLRCLARVARRWEEAGETEMAADCYLRCIDADELFEPPYRHLMLCYKRSGDLTEARTVYERLRAILSARLKVMPSPETQAVLASLETPAHG